MAKQAMLKNSIRLPEALYDQVVAISVTEQVSVNSVLVEAVSAYVAGKGREAKRKQAG